MPKIAVVTDRSDNFAGWKYLLKSLIPTWNAQGIETVVVAGPENYVHADAAFVHVDLTVVPEETVALIQRYPMAINGRAIDTRKRAYSTLLVDQALDHDGPVIVKTNLNCGGWREYRNHVAASVLGQLTRKLRGFETYHRYRTRREFAKPLARRQILNSSEYPIFQRALDVPTGVWTNPHLVVEKLVSERHDGGYCVRNYEFLGTSEGNFRISGKTPIVKYSGSIETLDDPVPANVREIRERLGLDFGKIDYGMIDGQAVVYDVNRTTAGVDDDRPLRQLFSVLEKGIWDFLPRAPCPKV